MNKIPFIIFKLNEDGRHTVGNPLGVMFVVETDGWTNDKRTAVAEFVKQHPEQKDNAGWLAAENVYPDTFDKIDEMVEQLRAWEVARNIVEVGTQ